MQGGVGEAGGGARLALLYADEMLSIFNNAKLWWITNCVFSGFDSLFEYVNTAKGERGDSASCFPIKLPDKTTLVGSGGATRRVRSSPPV